MGLEPRSQRSPGTLGRANAVRLACVFPGRKGGRVSVFSFISLVSSRELEKNEA